VLAWPPAAALSVVPEGRLDLAAPDSEVVGR
jgi:hypothetical protein